MNNNGSTLQRSLAILGFTACILACLVMHVVPALLMGMLAFVLTGWVHDKLANTRMRHALQTAATAFIMVAGTLVVIGIISASVAGFLSGKSLNGFVDKLSDTIIEVRNFLPAAVSTYVPDSFVELKTMAASALKEHANTLASRGGEFLHHLVLFIIAAIVGVMLALSRKHAAPGLSATKAEGVFEGEWMHLWRALTTSFKQIALAQTKIALINAILTAIFLLGILPLVGWDVPYAKILVAATFVFGLLPVVGNLISNTLIVLLALSVAFPAAVTALVFLLVVHKLEYFLNSRIQGDEIGVKSWEMLLILFIFETLFGPAGMVAAPIIYAVAKKELKRAQWIA